MLSHKNVTTGQFGPPTEEWPLGYPLAPLDPYAPSSVYTLQEVMGKLLLIEKGVEMILGHRIPPVESTLPD